MKINIVIIFAICYIGIADTLTILMCFDALDFDVEDFYVLNWMGYGDIVIIGTK